MDLLQFQELGEESLVAADSGVFHVRKLVEKTAINKTGVKPKSQIFVIIIASLYEEGSSITYSLTFDMTMVSKLSICFSFSFLDFCISLFNVEIL